MSAGKESEGIKTGQVEAKYVSSEDDFCIFEATCRVPSSFTVGAVLIDNDHEHEMFIKDVEVLRDGDKSTAVYLDCESWVIDNEKNATTTGASSSLSRSVNTRILEKNSIVVHTLEYADA